MVKKYLSIIFIMIFVTGCFKDQPIIKDGTLTMQIFVKHEDMLVNNVPVTILTKDYNMSAIVDITDSTGMVEFDNLPYAQYTINATGNAIVPSFLDPEDMDTLLITGSSVIDPGDEEVFQDTIYTISAGSSPGIKINEIYSAGPPNNFFYFYDQFFELYNSSEDTLYLDGMIFCRMHIYLANVTYIFQFPGEPLGVTKEYPIAPGEFKVIAQDAVNHRDDIFNGQASVDLSHADFEFKNSKDYGDSDNPNVPNLDNLEVGHTLDFMVGVTGDVVLIADGSDLDYIDGIDIESVVDCVEWSSKADHIKDIEDAVDRGFGGVGQSKYSGTSIERIAKGFDTNNSSIDFEIINAPTPGSQHE